jgi:hypothetical protein
MQRHSKFLNGKDPGKKFQYRHWQWWQAGTSNRVVKKIGFINAKFLCRETFGWYEILNKQGSFNPLTQSK